MDLIQAGTHWKDGTELLPKGGVGFADTEPLRDYVLRFALSFDRRHFTCGDAELLSAAGGIGTAVYERQIFQMGPQGRDIPGLADMTHLLFGTF